MNKALAKQVVEKQSGLTAPLNGLLNELFALIPEGSEYTPDVWNVLSWDLRKGNAFKKSIDFRRLKNEELRVVIQLYILHLRMTKRITGKSAVAYVNNLICLDRTIEDKKIEQINNGDFYEAERLVSLKYSPGTAARSAGTLETFSSWLNSSFGLRVSYKKQLRTPSYHGRNATDDKKTKKLMPDEVIMNLVASRHAKDLLIKDEFGIAIATIAVATGFRIGEIVTLPVECTLEENEAFGLLYYPEKGGVPVPRWILPSMVDAVKESVFLIKSKTQEARECAFEQKGSASVNWARVFQNAEATEYFVEKFCHEWTSQQKHLIFQNKGVWVEQHKQYMDIVGLLKEFKGNKSSLSRTLKERGVHISRDSIGFLELCQAEYESGSIPQTRKRGTRHTWDTDSRIISSSRFYQSIGRIFGKTGKEKVHEVIEKAQALQLKGKVYPTPLINLDLEEKFSDSYRPVIVNNEGKAMLWPHEALFVILKNQLSAHGPKKDNDFHLYSSGILSRWFNGEKRSRGTKNFEDSCWSRLGIIDPKTDETASYTVHDFRHWLNTKVNEGGLSEDQIALMFGRKTKGQNATYDQRSQASKVEGLRKAIKNGEVLGNIAHNYNLLAEESREEAERYLEASTLMANIMPHGICSNNWASTPCPHQLSCLSCTDQNEPNDGPCEMLFVDPEDDVGKKELERIEKNAVAVLEIIPSSSPQTEHYQRVKSNSKKLLEEIETGQKCKRSKAPVSGKWEQS